MKPDYLDILKLDSLRAAPKLLGWEIVRPTPEGEIRLKIVETEAYHQDDPASHSYRGLTARTAPMFKAGGAIYVYFTYGAHYCLNFVTGPRGVGEAVLTRAGEPLEGIEIMRKNRQFVRGPSSHKLARELANGPAKLAQALGIKDTSLSGKILNPEGKYLTSQVFPRGQARRAKSRNIRPKPDCYADIFLEPPKQKIKSKDIIASPRIGIRLATEQPWRFYIKNNPFVSKVYSKPVHK